MDNIIIMCVCILNAISYRMVCFVVVSELSLIRYNNSLVCTLCGLPGLPTSLRCLCFPPLFLWSDSWGQSANFYIVAIHSDNRTSSLGTLGSVLSMRRRRPNGQRWQRGLRRLSSRSGASFFTPPNHTPPPPNYKLRIIPPLFHTKDSTIIFWIDNHYFIGPAPQLKNYVFSRFLPRQTRLRSFPAFMTTKVPTQSLSSP